MPLYFVEIGEITPMPSIEGMTLEALSRPRGIPPLQDLLSPVQNIGIIVDDWTCPTPVAEILEVLLPRLANYGFSREHITIVVALGTHEAMKREELEARAVRNVASSYKVLQHNA